MTMSVTPEGGLVHTQPRPRPSWPVRLPVVLAAIIPLVGLVGITPANATVYNSCTISRCADARSANSIWAAKNYPTSSGWYAWTDGRDNYTGGGVLNQGGPAAPR